MATVTTPTPTTGVTVVYETYVPSPAGATNYTFGVPNTVQRGDAMVVVFFYKTPLVITPLDLTWQESPTYAGTGSNESAVKAFHKLIPAAVPSVVAFSASAATPLAGYLVMVFRKAPQVDEPIVVAVDGYNDAPESLTASAPQQRQYGAPTLNLAGDGVIVAAWSGVAGSPNSYLRLTPPLTESFHSFADTTGQLFGEAGYELVSARDLLPDLFPSPDDPPPIGTTYLFTDDFQRPDELLQSPWIVPDSVNTWRVSGNRLTNYSNVNGYVSRAFVDSGVGDSFAVQAKITAISSLADIGVHFRATTGFENYWLSLRTHAPAAGWTNGDTFRMEFRGSTVKILRNGTTVQTVHLSSVASDTTGTFHGLRFMGGNGHYVTIDNFIIDNLSSMPPGVYWEDSFDRPDGVLDDGWTYTSLHGSWEIFGNAARLAGSDGEFNYALVNVANGDHRTTVTQVNNPVTFRQGVVVRYLDAGNYIYAEATAGVVSVTGGQVTSTLIPNWAGAATAGDTISIECDGDQLTLYRNSVVLETVTIPPEQSAGTSTGVFAAVTGAQLDDLLVEPVAPPMLMGMFDDSLFMSRSVMLWSGSTAEPRYFALSDTVADVAALTLSVYHRVIVALALTPAPVDGVTIVSGDVQEFVATATWSDGATSNVSDLVVWHSQYGEVAQFVGNRVLGDSPGETNVWATFNWVVSSSVHVFVDPSPIDEDTDDTPAPPTPAYTVIAGTGAMLKVCDLRDVIINGLVLNTTDSDGTTWIVTDIEGWHTTPDSDIPDEPRPDSDEGSYDLSGRYQARQITIKGIFHPMSAASAAVARKRLMDAVNLVRTNGLLVMKETPNAQAIVRLSGKPHINTIDITGTTEFEVGLRAPDPMKYSTDLREILLQNSTVIEPGTGITLPIIFPFTFIPGSWTNVLTTNNLGLYTTYPMAVFRGPLVHPRLTNATQDRKIEFNLTLSEEETLEVDFRARTVLLNGVLSRRSTMTVDSRWWAIPPGKTLVRLGSSNPSDTGSVVVSYRAAWM